MHFSIDDYEERLTKVWRRDYRTFLARKCGACCNDFRKKARVVIHVAAAESGSQGALPDPSSIRTGLVGFTTYGSSLSKVAINNPPSQRPIFDSCADFTTLIYSLLA